MHPLKHVHVRGWKPHRSDLLPNFGGGSSSSAWEATPPSRPTAADGFDLPSVPWAYHRWGAAAAFAWAQVLRDLHHGEHVTDLMLKLSSPRDLEAFGRPGEIEDLISLAYLRAALV